MKLALPTLLATCGLLAVKGQNMQTCVTAGTFDSTKDYFPDKVKPTESLLWDIQYFKTYKILRNEITGESFVLYQCGTTRPQSELNKGHEGFIPVPLKNGIALSTTTIIPHFELLGQRTKIKAWLGSPDYISSPCLNQLIDAGSTVVVKDTSNQAAVNGLKTKFGAHIVSFHNYRDQYKSTLLNVTDSSYLESTNEAVFEWNKFFAVFFNLEKRSNLLFAKYQARYKCYAEEAIDIDDVILSGVKPRLLWASYTNYGGVEGWDVAECPNYYCEYANLCAAKLITSRAGTIEYFGKKILTTAAFVELAKDVPYWIYPSNNWDEAYAKYATQLNQFASVKIKQVYDTSGSGPNAWFENRLAEYDVVLQDVCSVVGTADPLHQRKFMRNVFKEKTGQTASQCKDPTAALVTRATPCRRAVFPPGTVCFSGENFVELKHGTTIPMQDLRIGDFVKTGADSYSRVYSFGHFDAEVETTYLQIFTKKSLTKPIEISADHMIFVGKDAMPAGAVKVGNQLTLGNGEMTEIVDIKSVIRIGAYAPFTHSGTIVVNDIVASNYVSFEALSGVVSAGCFKIASYQRVAHFVQTPHRIYCTIVSKCETESYTPEGFSEWIESPLRLARWWLDQSAAMKAFVLFPAFAFLSCFSVLEMLIQNPWITAIGIAFVLHRKLGATKIR